MKFLKAILSVVPLLSLLVCIYWGEKTFDAHLAITWFGLGFIATLTFWLINLVNGDVSIEDLFFGAALISMGFFSAIIVWVIGFVSLSDPRKRVAYIADQVSREARSGIFD